MAHLFDCNQFRAAFVSFHLQVPSPLQEGPYAFEFEGEGESGEGVRFSAETTVKLPTEPRIYTLPSGFAYLYGFAPDETLQVVRYEVSERGFVEWDGGGGITETYSLVDERVVTVPADGAIALPNFASPDSGPYGIGSQVIAIGSVSGEVSRPFPMRGEDSVLLGE